jgi:hypothetical protein
MIAEVIETLERERGSNPRRPVWENVHSLKIQDLASTVSIADHRKLLILKIPNLAVVNGLQMDSPVLQPGCRTFDS